MDLGVPDAPRAPAPGPSPCCPPTPPGLRRQGGRVSGDALLTAGRPGHGAGVGGDRKGPAAALSPAGGAIGGPGLGEGVREAGASPKSRHWSACCSSRSTASARSSTCPSAFTSGWCSSLGLRGGVEAVSPRPSPSRPRSGHAPPHCCLHPRPPNPCHGKPAQRLVAEQSMTSASSEPPAEGTPPGEGAMNLTLC